MTTIHTSHTFARLPDVSEVCRGTARNADGAVIGTSRIGVAEIPGILGPSFPEHLCQAVGQVAEIWARREAEIPQP